MLVLDPVIVALNNLPPWAFTLAGVVVATALLAARSKSKSHAKLRKIHSLDTTIPIIGDMLEVRKTLGARHDWIADMSLRFKNEPWQIRSLGVPDTIVLSDPATIEAVMINHADVFIKGKPQYETMYEMLGDGILNVEGEQWYHQRKTAAKFFSARTLRVCMMQTMQRNVEQVYKVLDAQCGTGSLVNLTNVFQQFALQTFLEVGVGINAPIIGKGEPSAFKAFDEAILIFARRRIVPKFVWKLERWLNIGPEKRSKELVESVRSYINDLVKQSLSSGNGESGREQDEKIRTAIELFVEHSGDDKAGLRPRDLVDFLLNFVVASRDTSALTTQWLFYQLGKHPEVVAKIREEFAVKLPQLGVGPDGYITADHVKQLVYLESVIKETLRLKSTAPLLFRVADQDTVIDGDIPIRKGQMVGLSAYAMARNTRVWGPDAAEYKPERWIDPKTGELLSFPATKFFAFSAGPRQCIGMKLAMLNLRVMTANLLHRYKFEIDPANDGSHVNAPVLVMKHNLLAKVARV